MARRRAGHRALESALSFPSFSRNSSWWRQDLWFREEDKVLAIERVDAPDAVPKHGSYQLDVVDLGADDGVPTNQFRGSPCNIGRAGQESETRQSEQLVD